MLKMHTGTLHHVITVYNDMFDHMHGVMGALAKKKIYWKEDLFIAMEVAQQKLPKYYDEVTPRPVCFSFQQIYLILSGSWYHL
jgi:hypothetical protein